MADEAKLWVNRGEANEDGEFYEYTVPAGEGMVVLDAIHWIQQNVEPDLAARWNCKAAKCGSCSAEVNGKPSLMCKTRLSDFPEGEPITVEPMRTFPRVRDLVTDVSWNYSVNAKITPFTPPDTPQSEWRWQQEDGERSQEFRKCIECFLCMDTCHVLRNHETDYEFFGPRFLVRAASLEMHPLDQADRKQELKYDGGIGYCNINKCCTDVCPEPGPNEFDLGLATQSMCLAAEDRGLGTVIVGLFDQDAVDKFLKLPKGYETVALIPMGVPAHQPSAPKRREIAEFLHIDTF